jgi:hypothetical protein
MYMYMYTDKQVNQAKAVFCTSVPNKHLFTICNRGHAHSIELTHTCDYNSDNLPRIQDL